MWTKQPYSVRGELASTHGGIPARSPTMARAPALPLVQRVPTRALLRTRARAARELVLVEQHLVDLIISNRNTIRGPADAEACAEP